MDHTGLHGTGLPADHALRPARTGRQPEARGIHQNVEWGRPVHVAGDGGVEGGRRPHRGGRQVCVEGGLQVGRQGQAVSLVDAPQQARQVAGEVAAQVVDEAACGLGVGAQHHHGRGPGARAARHPQPDDAVAERPPKGDEARRGTEQRANEVCVSVMFVFMGNEETRKPPPTGCRVDGRADAAPHPEGSGLGSTGVADEGVGEGMSA